MSKHHKRPSLIRQAQERFDDLAAYGESKHLDKLANGGKPLQDSLYSYCTTTTYLKRVCPFLRFAKQTHDCRWLDEARPYVTEYLQLRIDAQLSAWTIHTDAAALAKLYGCSLNDFGISLPRRERGNIQRNRKKQDNHKKERCTEKDKRKRKKVERFCRGCGVRYHELERLRPEDVRRGSDGLIYVTVRKGKGGKHRTCIAVDDYVLEVAEAAAAAGQEYIFSTIPEGAPIHAYRRLYAQAIYRRYARPIATLPREEKYFCRKDMKGIVLDRIAMQQVSYHLGHTRLDVTTTYLKGIQLDS